MMTPDTADAIKAIMPMAYALDIKVRVSEDGKKLICNDQVIGISGNSSFATIMEFVGYVFVRFWMRNYDIRLRSRKECEDIRQAIQRYWFGGDQNDHDQ